MGLIVLVLIIVALVLAIVDLARKSAQDLLSWAVVILSAALLIEKLAGGIRL